MSLDALTERDGVHPVRGRCSPSRRPARFVAVPRGEESKLIDACVARGVPVLKIGETGTEPGAAAESGEALEVAGLFTVPLSEADAAFRGTQAIFG